MQDMFGGPKNSNKGVMLLWILSLIMNIGAAFFEDSMNSLIMPWTLGWCFFTGMAIWGTVALVCRPIENY